MTAVVVPRVQSTRHAPDKPLPPPPPPISRYTPSDTVRLIGNGDYDPHSSRAASSADLPRLAEPEETPLKRTFSDTVLNVTSESPKLAPPEEQASGKEILRRASTKRANGSPKVNGAAFALPQDENTNDIACSPKVEVAIERIDTGHKTKTSSVSGKFGSFARRKSWFSSSPTRSSSPSPEKRGKLEKKRSNSPEKPPKKFKEPVPRTLQDVPPPKDQAKEISRKGTILERTRRPLSVLLPQRRLEAEPTLKKSPSSISLRASKSFEKLPSLPPIFSKSSVEKVPPIPNSFSTERLSALAFDPSRKKDELWNAFRTLDGDYSKFQSKPSNSKSNVVRSNLLPFLTRHANDLSHKSLRAEDLDRRINILNKWWTGLLEMLNGKNNQAINGIDRPIFLDAVSGIMTRPEWRIPPFPSPAVTPTEKSEKVQSQKPSLKSRSTTSLESSGSDFLVESIYHNIRNVYVQNLLSQMAFVVERMSTKTAPASLVSFCGKAIAYAFFFCPGVADILVRLWETSQATIRATMKIFVDGLGDNLTSTSKEIATAFPPSIRPLAFKSYASFIRYLRQRVTLPLGAGAIRWNSPGWKRRWSGRDSDLFFVFTKHFHVLVSELLPPDVDKKARVCVPGLLSVHAQILTILEHGLQKWPQQQQAEPSVTFDEVLDGVNTSAAALPMPVAGVRLMAENRLIILLRDFLAGTHSDLDPARRLFADSFADILKAVARKTSQFDSYTCISLCDFMEEVITIMFRYRNSVGNDIAILDWPFWMTAMRTMMGSQNTLVEVRVLSFLYCGWNTIIADGDRKRDLCLGWLLEESFFRQKFNHWCPMVRGYFHRLLCWRVAGIEDDPSDLDIEIYETFLQHLRTNWAHIIFLQQQAEVDHIMPPSTAPCSPAPQRRLMIIRDETPALPTSLFVSFEKTVPNQSSTQATAYRRDSLLQSLSQADVPSPGSQRPNRWSILKNIFPATGNDRPGEVTPPQSSSDDDPIPSLDSGNSIGTFQGHGLGVDTNGSNLNLDRSQYQTFSFKFSLEWINRPMFPNKNQRLSTPRLPRPAENFIQSMRLLPAPNVTALEPKEIPESHLKYGGRALAEWAGIVDECDNFFDRRKKEGVPMDRLVETPLLLVDNFTHPR